ncbi:MAG: fimbrillin family protein [Rikenellaceae bacterium]
MKKLIPFLTLLLFVASCANDTDVSLGGTKAVAFSAESIAQPTKVNGTSWNKGDAIGITMFSGSDQSVIYDNIEYTATSDGTNVSFNPVLETILYPQDGSAVDFKAYYPYQEGFGYEDGSMIFDISAQDGTLEAQSKVDLLESAASAKVDGDAVSFQFTHSLSKVQITVSNIELGSAFANFSALTATLYTSRTQYDMLEGTIVSGGATKELVMVASSNDGETALFTAIIAPGTMSDEIIFNDGTSYYTTSLAIESAEANKQYNYTLKLSPTELVLDGITIGEWGSSAYTSTGTAK